MRPFNSSQNPRPFFAGPGVLAVVELTPLLIPYFLGFFLFQGLNAAFPLYLQLRLGLSEKQVVVMWTSINSVALLVGALTRIPAGLFADKVGRQKALFIGFGLYFTSIAILWNSTSYFAIAIAISLIRIGVNLYAMSGRATVSRSRRDKGFKNGILTAITGLGGFVGATALTAVLDFYPPEYIIILTFILILGDLFFFVLSLAVIPRFFAKITNGEEKPDLDLYSTTKIRDQLSFEAFQRPGIYKSFLRFLTVGIIIGLIRPVYPIYGKNVLSLTASTIGLAIGLSSLAQIIWAPIVGRALRKYSADKVANVMALGFSVSALTLMFSRISSLFYVLSLLILTMSTSGFFTADITRQSQIVKKNEFSLVFGTASTLVFVGSSASSYVSGILYQMGPETSFVTALLVSLVVLVFDFAITARTNKKRLK